MRYNTYTVTPGKARDRQTDGAEQTDTHGKEEESAMITKAEVYGYTGSLPHEHCSPSRHESRISILTSIYETKQTFNLPLASASVVTYLLT